MLLFSQDQVHIGHCCTWQLLLCLCCATIVSLTVLLQEPQVGPYWSYALFVIQNFKNQTGFCSKFNFFEGSSAHLTLLYMTIATLPTWRYNSVIDSFAPRASSGTILELCSFSYSKFQKSNWILLKMSLFRRIKCTLDSAAHNNFYSAYMVLQ
jgi:hypothetical protein